jgi:sugar diacid utilization regulator
VVAFDDVIVAIESIDSIDLGKDRLPSSLLFRARSLLSLGDVMVGAGRILTGTEGIFRSYREARWATIVGHGQHGPNRVIDFSELGVYAWLEPIDFDQSGQAVTEIQRIVDHDVKHGTRLLETLQTYLDARRFKEAADRLYVHRNTLRYRLDSIRKLTGLDVQDAEARLVLEVQLRLAKVRGLVPTDVKAEI